MYGSLNLRVYICIAYMNTNMKEKINLGVYYIHILHVMSKYTYT